MREIQTFEELKNISNPDEDLLLVDDIYVTEAFTPIQYLTTNFNGNGYTIYNLQNPLIKTIHTTVKNIEFDGAMLNDNEKCSDLNHYGIFIENKGVVENVTVKNSEIDGTHKKNCGVVTGHSKEILRDCTVKNSEVISKVNVGLLAGEVVEGKVKNCTVGGVVSSVGSTQIGLSGGICGSLNNATVKSCTASDIQITGDRKSSGAFGEVNQSVISDISVKCASIRGSSTSGIASNVSNSQIYSCSVENMNLISFEEAGGLVSILRDESIIKDSFVRDSSIKLLNGLHYSTDSLVGLTVGSSAKKIINCFSENVTIEGNIIALNSTFEYTELQHVYIDETVQSIKNVTESTDIPSDSSVYINRDFKQSPEKKTVEITKPSDFNSVQVNDRVVLTTDVDLSDISMPIDLFSGEFIGNMNYITGLNGALFKYITEEATIKNLKITDCDLTCHHSNSAVLATITEGDIKNVEVEDIMIELDGSGLFGVITAKQEGGLIKNCSVTGEIDLNVCKGGGIAAEASRKISNCKIDLQISNGKLCGGIVAKQNVDSEVYQCEVEGEIESRNNVGGIAANCVHILNRGPKIIECISKMDIIGSEEVGGIVGKCSGTVRNCKYSGSIKGDVKTGGIVGKGNSTELVNCESQGRIAAGNLTGGLVGYAHKSKISKCKNYATVKGKNKVGGLIGCVELGCISRVSNTGKVDGSNFVGGLVGLTDTHDRSHNGTIEKCYTVTFVSSKSNVVGPLFGEIYAKDYNIEDLFWIKNENKYSYEFGSSTEISAEELDVLLKV